MNVALLTTRLFDQPGNGGEICTARLLRELVRAGHGVLLIGRGPVPTAGMPGVLYHSVGPLVTPFEDLPQARRLRVVGAALLSGQASTVQRQAEGGVARRVQQLLQQARPRPDALIVDHLQVLPWASGARSACPTLMLIMHNVESENYAESAQRAGESGQWLRRLVLLREARILRKLERDALNRAGAVACLSQRDAGRLRQTARLYGGRARLEVLPSFPLQVRPPAASASLEVPGRRIGMIGTWTWEPNRVGLQWMLDRVLPHLPPNCALVLAGTGLERATLPSRVESMGRVTSAEAFYRSVDVVALSAQVGSGVQEKAVEAIAMARLVVATPHSLRGLRKDLPGHVQVTADARRFALLCADAPLVSDPAWAGAIQAWREGRQGRYAEVLGSCLQ
jgi:hypothetical protein